MSLSRPPTLAHLIWKTLNFILYRIPSNTPAPSLATSFLWFVFDKIERIRAKFSSPDSPDPSVQFLPEACYIRTDACANAANLLMYIMSCHAMSCHVMSCHVTSCHVTSRRVTSCHVMSRHVTLRHGTARHGKSRHAMPCHIRSGQVR